MRVLLRQGAVGVVVDGKEDPLLFHVLAYPLDEDLVEKKVRTG